VWAFELGGLAPKILERLRDAVGGQAPAALRFAPGHLPEAPPGPAATPHRPVPKTSPEVAARAATLAAGIADDELRERVARAAELSFSRLPDDRSL
jgi:hypothetical protein